MSTGKDRYPGLRAFEKDDAGLFFGRNDEARDLTALIEAEKITILFGNSGTGKSSLLNTKILENLEAGGYLPVRIRFTSGLDQEDKTTPVETVQKELEQIIKELNGPVQIIFDAQNPRLWEFVKLIETAARRKNVHQHGIVLVFDQFEEFFYFPETEQTEFMHQIAELAHDWPPKRILDWVNRLEEPAIVPEVLAWHHQPDTRILFSIRADKLSLMNDMVKVLPKVLRSRFELKTFKEENARKAITGPALLPNPDRIFNSPPIHFKKEVEDRLIKDLCNEYGEIEVSFLQVTCNYLEGVVREKVGDQIIHPYRFTEKDLEEQNFDVSTILDKHYVEQTEGFSLDEKKLVRKVIEEDLVISGQRASLLRKQLKDKLEGKEYLITSLLKARLIREETTARGITYELSHDRLIPTVEKYKNIRQTIERNEALEKETRERKKYLDEQRIQLNKEKRLRFEADTRRREADEERLKAEVLKKQAEKEKLNAEYLRGKAEKAQEDANRQRLRARWLSYGVLALGIALVIYSIISINRKKKYLQEINERKAGYFLLRGKEELKKHNVHEGFNYLWASDSLVENKEIDSLLESNGSCVFECNGLMFSEDGNTQAYLMGDKLQIWQTDVLPFKLIKEFSGVESFVLSGNGETAAVFFKGHDAEIWLLNKNKNAGFIPIDTAYKRNNPFVRRTLTMSWNGSSVAYYDTDDNIRISVIRGDTLIRKKFMGRPKSLRSKQQNDIGVARNEARLAFSRDGKKIITSARSISNGSGFEMPVKETELLWADLENEDRYEFIPVKKNNSEWFPAGYGFYSISTADTLLFIHDGWINAFDFNTGKKQKIKSIKGALSASTELLYKPASKYFVQYDIEKSTAQFFSIIDTSKIFSLQDISRYNYQVYTDRVIFMDTMFMLKSYNFKENRLIEIAKLSSENVYSNTIKYSPAFFTITYSDEAKQLFYIDRDTLFSVSEKGDKLDFQKFPAKYPRGDLYVIGKFIIHADSYNLADGKQNFRINFGTYLKPQELRGLIPYSKLD